jgi:hypothetical protein
MVNGFTFPVSDLPTGCAAMERDDFAVAVRAVRVGAGWAVSSAVVALVVRVEARVAIAFGFALDAISC